MAIKEPTAARVLLSTTCKTSRGAFPLDLTVSKLLVVSHSLPCAGNDGATLTAIVVIGSILMLIVAVAASVLNDHRMGVVVRAIIVLQRFAVVGGVAATAFANSGARSFFLYLSLLNLNIQIVKPGCTVPIIAFTDLFW